MGAKSGRISILKAKGYSNPDVAASAVDFGTGTVHNVRANMGAEWTPIQPGLPDNRMVQFLHEKPAAKLGLKAWRLTFSTYLHSHGLTLDTSTPYAQTSDYLGFLLERGLGGETFHATAANSDVASGSATTGFVVTGTHGARFLGGQAYAINPNSLGYLEAREVLRAGTSDTMTCKVVHSQAMTTGDDVIGGQTTYCPQTAALSGGVHFLAYGADANDQIVLANGMCTGFALTITTGALPMINWTWEGTDWTRTTGQTVALQTYNGAAPAVVKDSELLISSIAGTTRLVHHATAYSYSISLRRSRWGSPSGVQGSLEPVHLGCDVGASITIPYDSTRGTPYDNTYSTGRAAGTRYQLFHQFGRTTGSTLLLSLPTLDVEPEPTRSAVGDGIQLQTIQFQGDCDRAISGGDDQLELANFRIHRL